MRFYKYTATRGVAILQNRELLVSKTSSFNDPFEFIPVVSGYEVERDIQIRLNNSKFLQQLMRNEIEQGRFRGTFQEFQVFLNRNLETYRQNMRRSLSQAVRNTAVKMQQLADAIVGVISLTTIENHPLMWAHYGESHKGILYEFDFSYLRDRQPVKVMYSAKRPTVNFEYLTQEDKIEKEMQRLMITKSPNWDYEEEYRLFFEPQECTEKECQDGLKRNFISIPGTTIRRIILGLRASDCLMNEMQKLVCSDDLKHIALEKTYIDEQEYKILSRPIE